MDVMIPTENQLTLFDYAALDPVTRIVVQQYTNEIKTLVKRAAQDIIEIGQKLIEVKKRLGHGNFLSWLEAEFDWKERTARQFMLVAEQFKSANFADLSIAPSALYLLASPSTPEPARQEALERAEAGERITYTAAKEIVQEHKAAMPIGDASHESQMDAYAEEESDEPLIPVGIVARAINEGVVMRAIDEAMQQPVLESRPARMNDGMYSSATDLWATPQSLFDTIDDLFGFDIDVCATPDNAKCKCFYTEEQDGLKQPWAGTCWMNPPYGDVIGLWVEKAYKEAQDGATVVCLLPARTDTAWFQQWCGKAQYHLFLRGRVKFGDGTNSAPFPSVIVVFTTRSWDMRRLAHLGLLYYLGILGTFQSY